MLYYLLMKELVNSLVKNNFSKAELAVSFVVFSYFFGFWFALACGGGMRV